MIPQSVKVPAFFVQRFFEFFLWRNPGGYGIFSVRTAH
jgi:hypothetical protein